MQVMLESPDQAQVIALVAELDAYQDTLYPPESRHALDLASLKQPNVVFAVARDAAGEAIGCGAVVLNPAYGELKRMYVHPRSRGQGAARAILALLEAQALGRGCRLLKLETGPYQPEALAFYAQGGYERRGPFGGYTNDPLSVFMQKLLTVSKETTMSMRATGVFEVKLSPQALADTGADASLGRMSLAKTFSGDLVGTSQGEMLMAAGSVKGSAGYVAIERVIGALAGRSGSFVLQHSGTMNRGAPQLVVSVVPDSGTGQLAGLAGTLAIVIAEGVHRYEFDYTLPAAP